MNMKSARRYLDGDTSPQRELWGLSSLRRVFDRADNSRQYKISKNTPGELPENKTSAYAQVAVPLGPAL
jgi:hypothetical protein